jgi:hypothetical protein
VKPHSVFLRKGCILSDRFKPLREPCGDNWTLVEEITAPVFDTMIRQAGWHFMWMQGSCSRRGLGLTPEEATQRALARALKGVARRFNAAELDSVQVTKYPGFYVAKVTLQPRHIQQHTSLDIADERHPQAVPAR